MDDQDGGISIKVDITQTFRATDGASEEAAAQSAKNLEKSLASMRENVPIDIGGVSVSAMTKPKTETKEEVVYEEVAVGEEPEDLQNNPDIPAAHTTEPSTEVPSSSDDAAAGDESDAAAGDESVVASHPCDDKSHTCDTDAGGVCMKTGTSTFACGCATGFECVEGCQKDKSSMVSSPVHLMHTFQMIIVVFVLALVWNQMSAYVTRVF